MFIYYFLVTVQVYAQRKNIWILLSFQNHNSQNCQIIDYEVENLLSHKIIQPTYKPWFYTDKISNFSELSKFYPVSVHTKIPYFKFSENVLKCQNIGQIYVDLELSEEY